MCHFLYGNKYDLNHLIHTCLVLGRDESLSSLCDDCPVWDIFFEEREILCSEELILSPCYRSNISSRLFWRVTSRNMAKTTQPWLLRESRESWESIFELISDIKHIFIFSWMPVMSKPDLVDVYQRVTSYGSYSLWCTFQYWSNPHLLKINYCLTLSLTLCLLQVHLIWVKCDDREAEATALSFFLSEHKDNYASRDTIPIWED